MGLLNRVDSINCAVKTTKINKFNKDNVYSTFPLSNKQSDLVSNTDYILFIKQYATKETIDNAIAKNPIIYEILDEYKLPHSYNIDNFTSIIMSHLIPCARMAETIYNNSKNIENEMLGHVIQAALLHDIGKIFIPSSILNKHGKLSKKEREIIELHNRLSYEILKTTDLDKNVALLALEHHDYNGTLKRTPENQTLTVADIYCALREQRPYKRALNDICAKTILYDMGANGKFDVKYVNYIHK